MNHCFTMVSTWLFDGRCSRAAAEARGPESLGAPLMSSAEDLNKQARPALGHRGRGTGWVHHGELVANFMGNFSLCELCHGKSRFFDELAAFLMLRAVFTMGKICVFTIFTMAMFCDVVPSCG